MDEIEDWDSGRKSVVDNALDRVKDVWNRAQGKQNVDDMYDKLVQTSKLFELPNLHSSLLFFFWLINYIDIGPILDDRLKE